MRELRPDRDKISRAMPLTAALEGGRLLLPRRATWEQEVVHELLAFPLGRHDDVVDALAYAVEAGRSGVSLLDWKTREPADDRDRPVERNAHGFAPFSLGLTFPGQPGHGRRAPGRATREGW